MHGRLTLRVPAAAADELGALIGAQPGVLGLEETPPDGAAQFAVAPEFQVVEYGTAQGQRFHEWLAREQFQTGDTVLLRVYREVTDVAALDQWWTAFARAHDLSLPVVNCEILPPEDYAASARARVRGQTVGRRLWVGPPWETPPADRIPIIIDPGMAFGTGDHPTTRFCLQALEQLAEPPRRILDLGTGSGVLAIAAARLFPKADLWLCDTDPLCAPNATRNFERNQLAHHPRRAIWGPAAEATQLDTAGRRFDLVLANIYLDVLLGLVDAVADRLLPGGRWVVSGLFDGPQRAEFVERARPRFIITRAERLADSGGPAWAGLELQPHE